MLTYTCTRSSLSTHSINPTSLNTLEDWWVSKSSRFTKSHHRALLSRSTMPTNEKITPMKTQILSAAQNLTSRAILSSHIGLILLMEQKRSTAYARDNWMEARTMIVSWIIQPRGRPITDCNCTEYWVRRLISTDVFWFDGIFGRFDCYFFHSAFFYKRGLVANSINSICNTSGCCPTRSFGVVSG